jgi:hypothetical protein
VPASAPDDPYLCRTNVVLPPGYRWRLPGEWERLRMGKT